MKCTGWPITLRPNSAQLVGCLAPSMYMSGWANDLSLTWYHHHRWPCPSRQGFWRFYLRLPDRSRLGRCTIQSVNYIWLAVASLVNAIWRWGGDSKQLGVQLILIWVFFVWASHNFGRRLSSAVRCIEKWSQMFNCLLLRCLQTNKILRYLSQLAL